MTSAVIEQTPAERRRGRARVLATWAQFDPFGPTIRCLGLAGRDRWGRTEVFCRSMHPLLDQTVVLGHLMAAPSEESVLRLLLRAFAGAPPNGPGAFLTAIPNLVTCADWEPMRRVLPLAFARTAAIQEADWGRELYYLGKYGGELFDRATEEMREANEGLLAHANTGARRARAALARERYADTVPDAKELFNYVPAPYRAGHLDHWWTVMTAPRHLGRVLPQLAAAWVASVHAAHIADPVTFDEVRDFLRRCGHPLWPSALTTKAITAQLGIR